MRGRMAIGIVAGGLALGGAAVAGEQTVLFDGTSLDKFTTTGDADWTVKDGYVEARNGKFGYLVSKTSCKDFDLTLEFWSSPEANSGVFFRCEDPAKITDTTCYEANIFDQRPDPAYRTGGITHIASPKTKIDAGGHWNTYEISAKGNHLTVTLNGTVTVDVEDASHAAGPIALQYAKGTIRFRNVKLTAE
jgi:3-keto-disaccharide hydrolase